jgi:hypothetical protein
MQQNNDRSNHCVFDEEHNVLESAERSERPPTDVVRWHSSDRYVGAVPASERWSSVASLNITRWRTGSQWSCRRAGVMCSRLAIYL